MRLRIQPRFCLILIAVMLIVFAISLGLSYRDLSAGAEKLEQAQEKYAQLTNELEDLREALAFAGTDEYVQRVARDELGMLMPGEIRYVSSGN